MHKFVPFTLIIFLILGSLAIFSAVSASEIVEDSWNTKTLMSQARANLGVVAVDGKIYAIGGATDSGYVGINERYDPKTDTWSNMSSMPTPRGSFAITAYQDKIYCIGGCINYTIGDIGSITYVTCDITEIYDTKTDSWSTKASIPVSGSAQAHVVNGNVFVLLNGDMDKYGNLYMYEPDTDKWTQKTSMPKEPYNIGSFNMAQYMVTAATHDKILLTGLFLSGTQEAMMYNPKTDEWTQIANPPWGVHYDSAIATTGVYAPQKIYLLGAAGNCVYDPVNDTWISIKDMPTPRAGFGVTVVDDILYVIGGYRVYRGNEITSFSVNEQYVPSGYKDTIPAPETSNTAKIVVSTYRIVAISALTIIVVVSSLFFYFKKRMHPLEEKM
jgi:hypothetical protein